MSNDPFSGYRNSGGLQETKALGKVVMTKKDVLEPGDTVELEWITGPSPETLFKRDRTQPLGGNLPETMIQPTKCEDIEWTLDKVKKAFVTAPQAGYKTAGFSDAKLTGFRDFVSCGKGEIPIVSGVQVPSESPDGAPTASTVNDESAQFRWGLQAVPPNYGNDLPGSIQLLQKGHKSGQQIWLEKRKGYKISGPYAGWQSASSAENGMVSSGTNI